MKSTKRNDRRGVILLIVLSLLALFLLIGITFVVASVHARRTASSAIKFEQAGDNPQEEINQVFHQIVRGPTSPNSALYNHDLLQDKYGRDTTDTIQADITTVTPKANATTEFVRLRFDNPTNFDISVDNVYAGRVLTYLNGPCRLKTTRIVGSQYTAAAGGSPAFITLEVQSIPPSTTATLVPVNGNRVLINSREFSGTGFGYLAASFDPTTVSPLDTRLLDLKDSTSTYNVALLPNHSSSSGYAPTWVVGALTHSATDGGANEDYDAADFQNPHLALRAWNGTYMQTILPSFHRPELVNYYLNQFAATWNPPGPLNAANLATRAALRRRVISRPLPEDHYEDTSPANGVFDPLTESFANPGFDPGDPTHITWDVDNDADGYPDSIWIDPGLPVQYTADGRPYKRLAAIMIEDLDSRLNLNAHGNLTHIEASSGTRRDGVIHNFASIQANTEIYLPLGQGYGPPEVNLRSIFTDAELTNLLAGTTTPLIEGRYGERGRTYTLPLLPPPGAGSTTPAITATPKNSVVNTNRDFEQAPVTGAATGYFAATSSSQRRGFGSPPDKDGDAMVGLDLRGWPIHLDYDGGTNNINTEGWGEDDELTNDPYEIDLNASDTQIASITGGQTTSVDNPFSAAELEILLRSYDLDSILLPNRIPLLAPNSATDRGRRLLTTDSFDTPVLPGALGSEQLSDLMLAATTGYTKFHNATVMHLLRAKLINKGTNTASIITNAVKELLPPDHLMGRRLDLNRPLGNGVDDDSDGIVDEPAEAFVAAGGSEQFNYTNDGSAASTSIFDHNNDGVQNVNDTRARQLLARHLYVLMMLLADDGFDAPIDLDGVITPAPHTSTTDTDRAYMIAQWAINVVDFRDADSIMTPFEFDITPFAVDGAYNTTSTWNVDDNVATSTGVDAGAHRGVVWGCERPELLITETLALHDRRSEDTDQDTATMKKTTDPEPNDDTFDQAKEPVDSLFVEIYNPWFSETNNDLYPGEFYKTNGATPTSTAGVNLAKTVGAFNDPVWRLVVTTASDPTLEDVDAVGLASPAPAIERAVYFAGADPTTFDAARTIRIQPTAAVSHYNSNTSFGTLRPGHYAVIGPGTSTSGETKIGDLNPPEPGPPHPNTRRITLTQNANPDTAGQVAVASNTGGANSPAAATIKPPVSIIIDRAGTANRRLGLNEPKAGYGGPWATPLNDPYDQTLAPAADRPALMTTGTTMNYRLIHLQRLADPTQAYHGTSNPYRTVDTMAVDLVAFNGIENDTLTASGGDMNVTAGVISVESRERGNKAYLDGLPAESLNNIWKREDKATPTTSQAVDGSLHIFPYTLKHSLGHLSSDIPRYIDTDAPVSTSTGVAANTYRGDPQTAFPWLNWNNRPYVSALELLQVPAVRSSQLLRDYSLHTTSNGYTQRLGDFGHLFNPFNTSLTAGADRTAAFYRIFELLEVPSRFASSRQWYDPATYAGTTVADQFLHPPFNTLSKFRDPGKMNINTIYDPIVWTGVLDYDDIYPGPGTALTKFNSLAASRRDYTPSGPLTNPSDHYQFDPASPTVIRKPFRSTLSREFVPLASMKSTTDEITGLLRKGSGNEPLFEFEANKTNEEAFTDSNSNGAWDTGEPFTDSNGNGQWDGNDYRNTNRNPYFHFSELTRLGNLTTTRSNVYAIWITIGYFEVEKVDIPTGPTALGPRDGWRLVQEMGIDTGDVKRHRGFYIYDRSIPTGYITGQDLNMDDGILVERFIE